ncbi:ATP-binding cassette, subfamily B [Lachnospiraceae bacterium RM5]|nr:ATP-binding cassette, subfamily B [Lachnospiraceae bacterium RM5]
MDRKDILKRVTGYIEKYNFLVVLSIVFAAISSLLMLYVPILAGKSIDFIITKDNVDFKSLKKILFICFIVFVTASIMQWIMNRINNKVTYEISRKIRKDGFEKIRKLSVGYIDGCQIGDIISRIINDVDTFTDGLLMGFTQFFTGIITILGTLFFMISISPIIAFVVVIVTPLSLFVATFISKHTFNMFKVQSEIKGKQTGFVDEIISGEKIVKTFTKEEDCIKEFDKINDELSVCSMKAVFYSSLTNPSTRFVNNFVYALVAICGAIMVIKKPGVFSVGMLVTFLSYANQYTKPFNEISGVVTEFQNAIACAGRVFEFIDEESIDFDNESDIVIDSVSGNIDIKNVSFSYDKEKKLIENFNLSVNSGKRVAIVGPTGCGKTTIINLLMRFYDVDKGEILVDGKNIKTITRNSLRKNYGMVLQETWLKEGTIRDNLLLYSDISDEEMIEAAKKSHAHGFIKRLKNGYDTYISEDGKELSNGQKQLLCITRIMLNIPPMLILDEATSSIDIKTEIRIQKNFKKLMEGRTSFVVAHRLSTIKESDIILAMKDGNIVEMGSHDELIKKNGFYASLYNSQFEQA